ncbi:RolB family protein [Mesorhizobium sp. ORM16]|uniref:RolB family protein n=1 Tax=Mesorhizobium sp. ORM16 TaxID=3376989 RepID=UPI0038572FD1
MRVRVRKYSEFCNRLKQAQSGFLGSPRAPAVTPATRRALLMKPLINDLNTSMERPYEVIEQGAEFLYLYLPMTVARECLESQSLAHIPERLRKDGRGLLAMATWPYDQITKDQIVNTYHRHGCNGATVADVEFFAAVPRTSLFRKHATDYNVSIRDGPFGPFDIDSIGHAMFVD